MLDYSRGRVVRILIAGSAVVGLVACRSPPPDPVGTVMQAAEGPCPTTATTVNIPFGQLNEEGLKPEYWTDVHDDISRKLSQVSGAKNAKQAELLARLNQIGSNATKYKDILATGDDQAIRLVDEFMEFVCEERKLISLKNAATALEAAGATLADDGVKIACGANAAKNAAIAKGAARLMGTIGLAVCGGVILDVLMNAQALGSDDEISWCTNFNKPAPAPDGSCEDMVNTIISASNDVASYSKLLAKAEARCWAARFVYPSPELHASYMRSKAECRLWSAKKNLELWCHFELDVNTGQISLEKSTGVNNDTTRGSMQGVLQTIDESIAAGQQVTVGKLCACAKQCPTLDGGTTPTPHTIGTGTLRSGPLAGDAAQATLDGGTPPPATDASPPRDGGTPPPAIDASAPRRDGGGSPPTGTCNAECSCEFCDVAPDCNWKNPCQVCEENCRAACDGVDPMTDHGMCGVNCTSDCWPPDSEVCYPELACPNIGY